MAQRTIMLIDHGDSIDPSKRSTTTVITARYQSNSPPFQTRNQPTVMTW